MRASQELTRQYAQEIFSVDNVKALRVMKKVYKWPTLDPAQKSTDELPLTTRPNSRPLLVPDSIPETGQICLSGISDSWIQQLEVGAQEYVR